MITITVGENHLKCDDIMAAKVAINKIDNNTPFTLATKSPGTGAKRKFKLIRNSNVQPSGVTYQQQDFPFQFSTLEKISNYQ